MSAVAWRSYHLFRPHPWDEFLRDAVSPFLERFAVPPLIERFFFIRYWERGPHIRLRLETPAASELDAYIYDHFNAYFARSPSQRIEEGVGDCFPNDSVQIIPYEPEVERYGGPSLISLAEDQFQASSRAVLGLLAGEGWCYERALGAAFQMHLMFANAIGFQRESLAGFLSGAAEGWLSQARPGEEIDLEWRRKTFENAYTRDREAFAGTYATLWPALDDGDELEQEWAAGWVEDTRLIARRLRQVSGADAGSFTARERSIFISFMHMTNNRLGLRTADEAYLAHVLNRAVQECTSAVLD